MLQWRISTIIQILIVPYCARSFYGAERRDKWLKVITHSDEQNREVQVLHHLDVSTSAVMMNMNLLSDVAPKGTPEDRTIGELYILHTDGKILVARDIHLEDTPRAWRYKIARGIRRDRPRKRLFSSEEAELTVT